MKTSILGAALAAALLAPGFAHAAADEGGLHGVVGMNLTGRGGDFATVYYTNGETYTLRAGQLFHLYGGLEYRLPDSGFALQANVGYHFDQAGGDNGDLRFSRVPVELIGLYKVAPSWRLGLGLRDATDARLHSSGATAMGDYRFKASVGEILQLEYLVSPSLGLDMRYVHEIYRLDGGGPGTSINGSHFGLGLAGYF